MLVLVEGPAGSGKSQQVKEMLEAGEVDVQADFTSLWVAMTGVERGSNGKYPIRKANDPTVRTGLAAYIRRAVVRQGLRAGLKVVATSGTPDLAAEYAEIASEHGVPFERRTIDPGEDVVRARLQVNGRLQDQCEQAINRWYRPRRTR